MANFRDHSKQNWSSYGTTENINAGSLQRIADATEKMAQSYRHLIDDRDYFQRNFNEQCKYNDQLRRSNAALRGPITKLKKKMG